MAEEWIGTHEAGYTDGTIATFAIVGRDDAKLIGAVGLRIDRDLDKAELGYRMGRPF